MRKGLHLPEGYGGGVEAIALERQRQITTEGWTPAHDDEHAAGELARAAACYALGNTIIGDKLELWPWERDWWKPKNHRADLVRAGALIAAEIDRIDRAAAAAAGAADA